MVPEMTLARLDHINIAAPPAVLDECRRFYVDVLGLHDGPRPPFRSRGYWLYAGQEPVVHLTESSEAGSGGTGAFNHIAFACEGLEAMLERLRAHAIEFTIDRVPQTGATQLFLRDPAGVGVELNFGG
jgi:catechol 2,3-dioxygenase-like lactoylglutathione lyase family enzyme